MSKRVIFEDSKTGKIIQVSDEVRVDKEFCERKECWDCPVGDKTEDGCIENCTPWVLENPQEAGKLMGYRVLVVQENAGKEEKDNNEENGDEVQNEFQSKSQNLFLLQHLNVEPEQVFEVEGDDEGEYLVNDRGRLRRENKVLMGGWM